MMRVAYIPEVFKVDRGWIVRVFRNGRHHGDVVNGITLGWYEPAVFSDERAAKKASELYLKLVKSMGRDNDL